MTIRDQSRRERIMNSSAQLPGDHARAEAEENADFDAMDSGNFSEQRIDGSKTNVQNEQKVNQSLAQLPGDQQRGADDRRVDEGGNNTSAKVTGQPSAKRTHAPSLSSQDLGNELSDGTKTHGKTVDG
jgi:hypothetical protein